MKPTITELEARLQEQLLLARALPGDRLMLADATLLGALDGSRPLTPAERTALQASPLTLRVIDPPKLPLSKSKSIACSSSSHASKCATMCSNTSSQSVMRRGLLMPPAPRALRSMPRWRLLGLHRVRAERHGRRARVQRRPLRQHLAPPPYRPHRALRRPLR